MDKSLSKEPLYSIRQNNERFRSPDISRRIIGKEDVAAHVGKKSRRAKSTQPSVPEMETTNVIFEDKNMEQNIPREEEVDKRWSLIAKSHENMSKNELLNNYRLLMNEKLRLERFLSVMTKNNEMARNRLESDLLDAMMCIEDLKQALEIRMARRRKIDPREAEERRYLIRQNKKLLNQLYEAAKKIERLEVTKVEMKEQLELLDFQIVEVENQKAMMEEELRKIPATIPQETQTEDHLSAEHQLINQLKEQLGLMRTDLTNQKAETAAALAKQNHLDNLVRELRRDNIELRDQLARQDEEGDGENSLAESDKPIVADMNQLKIRLEEQLEYVKDLEEKLNSSREYTKKLESYIESTTATTTTTNNISSAIRTTTTSSDAKDIGIDKNDANNNNVETIENQNLMFEKFSPTFIQIPKLTDFLLQETIQTFQTLLNEREQELIQYKQYILHNNQIDNLDFELILPQLSESFTQTDITMKVTDKIISVEDQIFTKSQFNKLEQIKQSLLSLLLCCENKDYKYENQQSYSTTNNCDDISKLIDQIYQTTEQLKLRSALSEIKYDNFHCICSVHPENKNVATAENETVETLRLRIEQMTTEMERLRRDRSIIEERIVKGNVGEFHLSHSSPSHLLSMDQSNVSNNTNINHEKDELHNSRNTMNYYGTQLQELRQTGDLELARAHLSLSERRRRELERRITELTDELARARAETRSAETSLSAARRTEVALRRRLLVAMDLRGTDHSNEESTSLRHSLGATINGNTDILDIVELQTELVKLQATNNSLNEAAQLDRTRLHDQAMRIDQLESEHRALLDRISGLQAAEAGAQRGIVRLQALYEDMLREYSESKSQEFNWRNRDRSQNAYRNSRESEMNRNKTNTTVTTLSTTRTNNNENIVQLEKQITLNRPVNTSTKEIVVSTENSNIFSQTISVVPCNSPTCTAVRNLLKSFQDRYSETFNQLLKLQNQQQQSLSNFDMKSSIQTPEIIQHLRNQLTSLIKTNTDKNFDHISLCLRLVNSLENWITKCLSQSDLEITQLRSRILELQMSASNSNPTITGDDNQLLKSCVTLNKKPDLSKLLLHEQEVIELRERLRDVEAQLQISLAHDEERNHIQ